MGSFAGPGRDPEKEARLLKQRFSRITRRLERTQKAKRLYRSMRIPMLVLMIIGGSCGAILYRSPWPPMITLKHAVSFAGCPAARAVGLAPSLKGNPGYWRRLDPSGSGWSCAG